MFDDSGVFFEKKEAKPTRENPVHRVISSSERQVNTIIYFLFLKRLIDLFSKTVAFSGRVGF